MENENKKDDSCTNLEKKLLGKQARTSLREK
jgi:hypothetical protein